MPHAVYEDGSVTDYAIVKAVCLEGLNAVLGAVFVKCHGGSGSGFAHA
jgi:hypothetical protein